MQRCRLDEQITCHHSHIFSRPPSSSGRAVEVKCETCVCPVVLPAQQTGSMTVHVGERPLHWGRQMFGPRKILSRAVGHQKTRQVKGHLDSTSPIRLPTILALIYSLGVPFPRAGHAEFSPPKLQTPETVLLEPFRVFVTGSQRSRVVGVDADVAEMRHKNERRKETLPMVFLLQSSIVTSRPLIRILSADRPRKTNHLQGGQVDK